MVDFLRRAAGVGNDYRGGAESGDAVELLGERHGQADAAVGGGIAGQVAGVQGDAVPGKALHVGHGRAVVEVGLVVDALLQDREHSGRGLPALLAGAEGADPDGDTVAVDVGLLFGKADHDGHRSLRGNLRVPEVLAGLHALQPRLDVGRRQRRVRWAGGRRVEAADGEGQQQYGKGSFHRRFLLLHAGKAVAPTDAIQLSVARDGRPNPCGPASFGGRAAGFHTEQISSAFRGRQAPGGNCGSRQISPMRSRCRRSTLLSKWPNMRLTW